MTSVAPEPEDDELHLLDADVEAANESAPREERKKNASTTNNNEDEKKPPPPPTTTGGRPRGVSRYVPADPEPYSYHDLLAGQRDPNIPGPGTRHARKSTHGNSNNGSMQPVTLMTMTSAPVVVVEENHANAANAPMRAHAANNIATTTSKKYAHRASIGHDGRVMEDRARGVQSAVGRPKVKSIFHAMAGLSKFGEDGSEMHPKLVAVDVDAYGEEWTFVERRNVAVYVFLQVLAWFVLAIADPDSWLRREINEGTGAGNNRGNEVGWG